MMDFIPDAQTLLIVVQGVDTGKPGYDKEKLIDAGLKYFQFWKKCIALSGLAAILALYCTPASVRMIDSFSDLTECTGQCLLIFNNTNMIHWRKTTLCSV